MRQDLHICHFIVYINWSNNQFKQKDAYNFCDAKLPFNVLFIMNIIIIN